MFLSKKRKLAINTASVKSKKRTLSDLLALDLLFSISISVISPSSVLQNIPYDFQRQNKELNCFISQGNPVKKKRVTSRALTLAPRSVKEHNGYKLNGQTQRKEILSLSRPSARVDEVT